MNALETIRDLVAKGERQGGKVPMRTDGARVFSKGGWTLARCTAGAGGTSTTSESRRAAELAEYFAQAANARPALKLLVEIVEAVRKVARIETDHEDTQTPDTARELVEQWKAAKSRLDALLAKLEEQDDV